MNAISVRGVVQNGRIEVDAPIDLPDGTELFIPLPAANPPSTIAPGLEHTPAAIAAWLAWFDALPTLKITATEEADTAAWRKKMNDHEIAKMGEQIEGLFR